ncbi:MAG TPA: diaminopimelate dehydrogenase [Candidatus Merdenecus merdavium]|nr:diaminopimelate dehydrogenase [Candidatus Merdenecus merdavium]
MSKIRIGIVGYGNLGKGVELALKQNEDMELVGVFTRRGSDSVETKTGAPVYGVDAVKDYQDNIDVMILCGGSATDLPEQSPKLARMFNIIDSFDTHAKIPEHFAAVDAASKEGGKLSIISVGWDPGLFSLNRLYAEAILPKGSTYTFWGKGVSQGHSDAIRRVDGVKYGIQYTVPVEDAMERVRACEYPDLTTREKHKRVCYVVAKEGADQEKIKSEIVNMPNYFADYDTTVTFITEEEFKSNHTKMPHGGFVMRSGKTGLQEENDQMIEYSLTLQSNPEFTSSVLVAYARAAYRMEKEGICGAKTVYDIAPGYLSMKTPEELRKELL